MWSSTARRMVSMTADPPSPSSRMLTLLSLLRARRDWPGAVLEAA
jgi:hypothetical protein